LQPILKTAMVEPLQSGMKASVRLLLLIIGLVTCARAQEPSPMANGLDEPALPDSKRVIPHPPSTGLLPESGAIPNPTSNPPIYSPLETKKSVVSNSKIKPPLRPKTQSKTQERFEEIRSIAMKSPHVVLLLKRANKASTRSARRNLMRAYYTAVCARMRRLDPKLKNSINTYLAEKTGGSSKGRSSKTDRVKTGSSKKALNRERAISSRKHSAHHKRTYSSRRVYPEDYDSYVPWGPYGPYGPGYGW
jgi:hypothetical protein